MDDDSTKAGTPPLAFSANTGFLWKQEPFLRRIGKAAAAGFEGIEFQDEAQGHELVQVQDALAATTLVVNGINTAMGDTFGRGAIPGSEDGARHDIDAAIGVAQAIGARAVHVMAGKTAADNARATLLANLRHALANTDLVVLVEPICHAKVPGYFLHGLEQAVDIVEEIDAPRLRIMFDCFHIRTATEDLQGSFERHARLVGHVQIASYPDRAEPDGEGIDYARLLPAMRAAGYAGMFGCEYTPRASVEEGLAWRAAFARGG